MVDKLAKRRMSVLVFRSDGESKALALKNSGLEWYCDLLNPLFEDKNWQKTNKSHRLPAPC